MNVYKWPNEIVNKVHISPKLCPDITVFSSQTMLSKFKEVDISQRKPQKVGEARKRDNNIL